MNGMTNLRLQRAGGSGELAQDAGTLALAAFLARYRGGRRSSYAVDLRDWLGWCASHGIAPLARSGHTSRSTYASWRRSAGSSCPPSAAG